MPSIGDTLRELRLRQGLTLEKAAESIRINARFLEAMEAEEWDKLPGPFFARSFLRQYATYLGVDPSVVRAELARWEQAAEAAPAEPEPASERITVAPIVLDAKARREALRRWLGSVAALVLAVVVCGVLYALWQRAHTAPAREIAATSPGPAARASEPVAPPSRPNAKPPNPAASPPAPVAPIHLETRATEEVWIRVTCDAKIAFAGTLLAGQSRAFQGRETIQVLAGNAGGLEAVYNGKLLGPLGPRGHIRVLELTPTEYRILERKPPPEPGPVPDEAARDAAGA